MTSESEVKTSKGNIPKFSGKAERTLPDGTKETFYLTIWDYVPRPKIEGVKKQ